MQPQPIEAVDMGDYNIILGYPWLRDVNPSVDWPTHSWKYRDHCIVENVIVVPEEKIQRALQKGRTIYAAFTEVADNGYISLRAVKPVGGEDLQQTTNLPTQYRDYADVGSEEEAGRLASHEAHDHREQTKSPTRIHQNGTK